MAITDKINCSDIRREKSLGLVARSSLIGTLMRAGLLIAAIPLSASAQTSEEIATLKAQVAALQTTVSALQNELTSVKSSKVFALNSFVSVDPNPENGVIGPHITFKGANIHIVSGSGSTIDNGSSTGLGNLIIGYDEYIANTNPSRNGSHNLVIGMYNQFTSAAHGGLVVGEINTIGAEAATVTGGVNNSASATFASVSGGDGNAATGPFCTVFGGISNTASVEAATVIGGQFNTASGPFAIVSGGSQNVASGYTATVTGGQTNTASGSFATFVGGQTTQPATSPG